MDDRDEGVERLESAGTGRVPRHTVAVVAVVAGAAITAGLLAGARHSAPAAHDATAPSARTAPVPPSVSSPARTGVATTADAGSVFMVPLGRCTRTDRLGHVTLAFTVTNLSSRRLQVVDVTEADPVSDARVSAFHLWARPCAVTPRRLGQSLPPSGDVVVEVGFDVGPDCPGDRNIGVGVTFRTGHRTLSAQSPALVNLGRLDLPGCRSH